jgi:hypothetical protein
MCCIVRCVMSDKKSNWFARHKVLTVVLVFVGLAIIGGAAGGHKAPRNSARSSSSSSASSQGNREVTLQMPAQPSVEPVDKSPHFEDGTYVVGTDIQPGTYRTRVSSAGCYYSRLAGFSGDLSDILANDNTNDPTVVTVKPTDKGFTSKRCGKWTQDLSKITQSTTTFGDGIYIVGTDIEPGTYKSGGQSGCYYSRLSGFSGDLGEILANDNTDSPAIVTIAPSDKGFRSTRCGTWTKI